MLRSSLIDYSDAYTLVKGNLTCANTEAQGQPNNGANRKVIFKNCPIFCKYANRSCSCVTV